MEETQEQLQQRIAAYLDGTLAPAEAARFEVFIANSDPALAAQIISMAADKHSLRSLPRLQAPTDLLARVMENAERTALLQGSESWDEPRRPRFNSAWAIAAALALVIGGVTFVLHESLTATSFETPDVRIAAAKQAPKELPTDALTTQSTALAENRVAAAGAIASGAPAAATLEAPPALAAASTRSDSDTRVALAPAPAALPAIAPAAATPRDARMSLMKAMDDAPATQKYASSLPVASAAEGLAALAPQQHAGEPLLLALAARDDADLARLREQLAQWSPPDVLRANMLSAQQNGNALAGQERAGFQSQAAPVGNGIGNSNIGNFESNSSNFGNGSNGFSNNVARSAANGGTPVNGPITYRVSLTQEQLDELVREFRVASLAQGNRQVLVDASRALVQNGAFARDAAVAQNDRSGVAPTVGGPASRALLAAPPASTTPSDKDEASALARADGVEPFGPAAAGAGAFGGGGGGGGGARAFGGALGSAGGGGRGGRGGAGARGARRVSPSASELTAPVTPSPAPAAPVTPEGAEASPGTAPAPTIDCLIQIVPPSDVAR